MGHGWPDPGRAWPPPVKRWMDATDPVSEQVLLELGRMRVEFPGDIEVEHAARTAARDYMALVDDPDNSRVELVGTALRLEPGPGETRVQVARRFLEPN